MDLVAGEAPDILLVIGTDDLAAFDDRRRFTAHLALGSGLDPTWLDLFAEAARTVTGADGPADFIDARLELEAPGDGDDRAIERVDPTWISAVAMIADGDLDGIAGRWIELVEDELGALPREEKPWIRDLAGRIVSSAARPTAPPTSCSRGRCGDRRDAGPRRVVRRQRSSSGTRGRRSMPAAISTTSTGSRPGGVRIRPYEIELIGDVARQVAPPPPVPLRDRHAVVGPARRAGHRRRPLARAIELARAAGRRARLPGRPLRRSNLYDLPEALDGMFDIVYTSRGVLGWLPDIRGWARVVAHFLAPGGTFFITEAHPVMQVFENEGVEPGELRLTYPYWEHGEPLTFAVQGSYADPTPMSASRPSTAGTTASARS